MVTDAIKTTKKSKALGPDRITPIHLHKTDPVEVSFFTKLVNFSRNSSVVPAPWKVGRVIPLPKPGLEPEQKKSYRPISLLSPVAKLVEKTARLQEVCSIKRSPTWIQEIEIHYDSTELSESKHQEWTE